MLHRVSVENTLLVGLPRRILAIRTMSAMSTPTARSTTTTLTTATVASPRFCRTKCVRVGRNKAENRTLQKEPVSDPEGEHKTDDASLRNKEERMLETSGDET